MKTNFDIAYYFKGKDYKPHAYASSYSGIYVIPQVYKENIMGIIESKYRPAPYVPMTVYITFKDKPKTKSMLWATRIEPCPKYINKVEWLYEKQTT